MKKLLLMLSALLLPLSLFQDVSAQVVQVKGVATVTYAATLTPIDKEKAYRSAQVAAVERYFAENGEAESQNFEAIQDRINDNLDKFILSTTVLNEQDQPGLRKYSVSVRIEINVAKLRNTLRGSSAVSKTAAQEKSQLAYVFAGRVVESVQAFDARVVKRMDTSTSANASLDETTKGKEGESIKKGTVSTTASKQSTASGSVDTSAKVTTGGSTTRKSDETTYRMLSLANSKTAITSVFSQGGFIVADPEFVLNDADFKAVNKDFSSGNDLAPPTMRAVVKAMRDAQVPYLVLATLDVGAPSQDQATGLQRVAVSVVGRVLDLSGKLPREVASVPAVQYFGVGPDNATATNKALKDAALAAAREVVSRLNAAGIR